MCGAPLAKRAEIAEPTPPAPTQLPRLKTPDSNVDDPQRHNSTNRAIAQSQITVAAPPGRPSLLRDDQSLSRYRNVAKFAMHFRCKRLSPLFVLTIMPALAKNAAALTLRILKAVRPHPLTLPVLLFWD